MEELKQLAELLKDTVISELKIQKHVATSDLINSVKVLVKEEVDKIVLEGRFLKYGEYVDRGRKKGSRKVPVQALMEWIRTKGFAIDEKEVKGMAFAIRETIYKQGIPTRRSRRLAPRRTGFVKEVLDTKERLIRVKVTKFAGEMLETTIINMVNETNKKLA